MDRREIELEMYDTEDTPAPQDLAYTIFWMVGLLVIACMIISGT